MDDYGDFPVFIDDDYDQVPDDSVLIVSSDEEDGGVQCLNFESVEILTTPREALVNLHPELMDEAKIKFTIFMGMPKKSLPNALRSVDVAVAPYSLDVASVNVDKTRQEKHFSFDFFYLWC
jgi:hypothetical protein